MQRYFLNDSTATIDLYTKIITITGDDAHHMANVMRMKTGDKVYTCYNSLTFISEIIDITNHNVTLKIVEELLEDKELPCEVTIAQGLVRKEKMEEVIDHITELGASFYLPVIMTRSNVKLKDEKLDKKQIRLNKIAKEAAEQAHRTKVLEVKEPVTFKDFIKISSNYDLCLVAHVDESNNLYLGDVITNENKILVLVGPEGGIDEKELVSLKEAGFKFVSLGKRVLRTEVAPSYIMSIIDYKRGNKHEI